MGLGHETERGVEDDGRLPGPSHWKGEAGGGEGVGRDQEISFRHVFF